MRTLTLTLLVLTAFSAFSQQAHQLSKHTIGFKENKGQVRDQNWMPRNDVLYYGEWNGLNCHFKQTGMHYTLVRNAEVRKRQMVELSSPQEDLTEPTIESFRVDIEWLGANKNAELEHGLPQRGYEHFYNVPNGNEPALYVKTFNKITYHNLYDGIDLVWFTNDKGQPEYDFIVKPGADFRQIQIQVQGASVRTTKQNELVIETPLGKIIEGGLKVYQNNTLVPAKWIVSNGVVSLAIQKYQPELNLVIDPPVRVWGTYLGGGQLDIAFNIGLSENNTVLYSGTTASSSNIATTGAHSNVYAGGIYDAFFAKFNDDGTVQFCTYYGGSNTDEGGGIGIDNQNNIYFSGYTNSSTNIGTSGTHSPTWNGQVDGFLVKFDQNGVRIWGTYFGALTNDYLQSIAVVPSTGEVYTTGYIINTNTGQDGYLAKYNTNGLLIWKRDIIGNGDDRSFVVKINEQNNPFVAGWTSSSNNIGTSGTQQPSYQSNTDAFVMSYDTAGLKNWGTYLGGSGLDQAFGLEVSNNVIYVAGLTASTSGISTSGSYKVTKDVGQDGFINAYNLNGTRIWGTYFGGNASDQIWRIERQMDRLYIGGITQSTNNIASTDGFLNSIAGGIDAFMGIFTLNGFREYATYYGGANDEGFYLLEVDGNLKVYIGGSTLSISGISTSNGYQTSAAGNTDAFLVQFADCPRIKPQIIRNNTDTLCVNQLVQFTAQLPIGVSADSIIWFADSLNGQIIGFNQILNLTATKSMKIYAIAFQNCGRSELYDSISIIVKPDTIPTLSASLLNTRNCLGDTIRFSSGSTDTTHQFSWTGPAGFTSSFSNPIRPSMASSFNGVYTVRATSVKGCVNTSTVTVAQSTTPSAISNSPICNGDTIRFFAINAATRSWTGPNGFASAVSNPTLKATDSSFSGTYSVAMVSSVGCSATVNLQVAVSPKPLVDITNKTNWCVTDTVQLSATSNAASYLWTGPNGFSANQLTITPAKQFIVNGGKYKLQATSAGGCANADSINLAIFVKPIANIVTSICSGDTIKFRTFNASTSNWTGPSSFASTDSIIRIPNASSTNAGGYKVLMNNGGVCFDSISFQLAVNAKPVLAITTDTSVCTGDTISVSSTSGLVSYAWSGPSGFTSSQPFFTRVNVQQNFSGYYKLTGTGAGNCKTTDSVLVMVNAKPTVAIVSNSGVCEGDTLTLTTNNAYNSYNWVGPTDLQVNIRNVTVLRANKSNEGNYSVTVVDSNGCKNSAVQLVQIRSAIRPATIATNSPICTGNTLSLAAGGTGIAATNWTSPTNTVYTGTQAFVQNVQLIDNGLFKLQTTDLNGCIFDTTVAVSILPLPAIDAASNGPICRGGTLELIAIKTDNGNALWRGPNGYATTAINPLKANMQFADSGFYRITFTNTNGCSNSDSIFVQVVVCASVAELATAKQITLYPNPTSGMLTIELPLNHEVSAIEMMGIDGKVVQTINVMPGEESVNTTLELANGMYMIQYMNKGNLHVGKVLIVK